MNDPWCSSEDIHEAAILTSMSKLADTTTTLTACILNGHTLISDVKWLWVTLTATSSSPSHSNDRSWYTTIRLIYKQKEHLTPFALHQLAIQASAFETTTNRSYSILCLLLCIDALQQLVQPTATANEYTTKRRRRCQSLVFETIALYQRTVISRAASWNNRSHDDDNDDDEEMEERIPSDHHTNNNNNNNNHCSLETNLTMMELWEEYVVPTCNRVFVALLSSDDTNHADVVTPSSNPLYDTAYVSAMVGTTSMLMMTTMTSTHRSDTRNKYNPSRFLPLIRSVIDQTYSKHHGLADDCWVWVNPWRTSLPHQTSSDSSCVEDGNDDNTEYHDMQVMYRYRNEIGWWNSSSNNSHSTTVRRREYVAGMETQWDPVGIALLAVASFHERPLIWSPNYLWNVWFPHVTILLSCDNNAAPATAVELLRHLLTAIPDTSLLLHSTPFMSSCVISKRARGIASPLKVFHYLSHQLIQINQVVVADIDEETGDPEQEAATRRERTSVVVELMRRLMSRYQPIDRVDLVRTLISESQDQPALQARFLDLTRPVLFDDTAHEGLWALLNTLMEELQRKFMEVNENKEGKEKGKLTKVVSLVDTVELYLAAATMMHLWCIVRKGPLPPVIQINGLRRFYECLKRSLDEWTGSTSSSSTAPVSPPDEYFRLDLLKEALHETLTAHDGALLLLSDELVQQE